MHILELLYEKPPTLSNFNARKVHIEKTNTIICGASGSGKTILILDFLKECKNYLYIDLNDLRVNIQKIQSNLENFIKEKRIELLVIDNYKNNFTLPLHVELILSTNDKSLEIENLEKIHLDMLDFEEFISFKKGSLSPETLFGQFAQHGRMALHVNENEKIGRAHV